MNNETKELLNATKTSVLNRVNQKKQDKEAIINELNSRIIKNTEEFYKVIAETIIKEYVSMRKHQVRFLLDEKYTNSQNISSPIYIPKAYNYKEKTNTYIGQQSNLSAEDLKAIGLLNEANLELPIMISILTKSPEDFIIWQKDEKNPKIAMASSNLLATYNIRISTSSYSEILVSELCPGAFGSFARKALANNISSNMNLDNDTLSKYKREIDEIEEKEKKIIAMRDLSRKNADLIQTQVLREILNKYESIQYDLDSNIKIETFLPVATDILQKEVYNQFDSDTQKIVHEYLSCNINDHALVAIPYETKSEEKLASSSYYLPMFVSDLLIAMKELKFHYDYQNIISSKPYYIISTNEKTLEAFVLEKSK